MIIKARFVLEVARSSNVDSDCFCQGTIAQPWNGVALFHQFWLPIAFVCNFLLRGMATQVHPEHGVSFQHSNVEDSCNTMRWHGIIHVCWELATMYHQWHVCLWLLVGTQIFLFKREPTRNITSHLSHETNSGRRLGQPACYRWTVLQKLNRWDQSVISEDGAMFWCKKSLMYHLSSDIFLFFHVFLFEFHVIPYVV